MNKQPLNILGHCFKTYNHTDKSFSIAITSLETTLLDKLVAYLKDNYKNISLNLNQYQYYNKKNYGYIKVEV